jgi:hypothetical protein
MRDATYDVNLCVGLVLGCGISRTGLASICSIPGLLPRSTSHRKIISQWCFAPIRMMISRVRADEVRDVKAQILDRWNCKSTHFGRLLLMGHVISTIYYDALLSSSTWLSSHTLTLLSRKRTCSCLLKHPTVETRLPWLVTLPCV